MALAETDWAVFPPFGMPQTRLGNLIVAGERSALWQDHVDLSRAPSVWEQARQL